MKCPECKHVSDTEPDCMGAWQCTKCLAIHHVVDNTKDIKVSRINTEVEPKLGGVAKCPKCGQPKPKVLRCMSCFYKEAREKQFGDNDRK